jgi:hypothetical protein
MSDDERMANNQQSPNPYCHIQETDESSLINKILVRLRKVEFSELTFAFI